LNEAKEKARRELEIETQAAAQSQQAENNDDDEGAATAPHFGVTEYFIAKRAAKRLKTYAEWKKKKDKKDKERKD